MNKIFFVTGNKGKAESLRSLFEYFNMPIEVEQIKLKLLEIQANSVEEVSIKKAKQAFEILKKPLIVEDGGFCVDALNNFPGVYTKYALNTIGVNGILKLMNGVKNRKCQFQSTLTFINNDGNHYSFNASYEDGALAHEKENIECEHAWSEVWHVYIIPELNRTLASMTEKEINDYYSKYSDRDNMYAFAKWYSNEFNIKK